MKLLGKTRRLNLMLSKVAGQSVNFTEMAEVLNETVSANVYVLSRKGKVLGKAIQWESEDECMQAIHLDENHFKSLLNADFISISETDFSAGLATNLLGQAFDHLQLCVVPVFGSNKRIGSILLVRPGQSFQEDDLVLAEYGATIVGMEILRERLEEEELEAREKEIVQVAVSSLSYSEQEAVEHIFGELNGDEGLLIASKIADREGITRSVIVNALRKLESARVVESRSLGMKGTYIKVLNGNIYDFIKQKK
jgi:transcriptional pleiotropic repressor